MKLLSFYPFILSLVVAIVSEAISFIIGISLLVSASKIGFAEAITTGHIIGVVILGLVVPTISVLIGFFVSTLKIFK